jgi:hypothetical protein
VPLVPDGRTVLTTTRLQAVSRSGATAAPPSFIPGTNLAERSFVEERRRTKVIPRLTDERAAMKLVFATMIRTAERWCRVSISDLERHQLRLLRAELGLDPPPAADKRNTGDCKAHDHQAIDLQDSQDLTDIGEWRRRAGVLHRRQAVGAGAFITADGKSVLFQQITGYSPPRWPDPAYPQQAHLDILVDDLDTGEARALQLGASRLSGGGKMFRVFADPAGHPFCLTV